MKAAAIIAILTALASPSWAGGANDVPAPGPGAPAVAQETATTVSPLPVETKAPEKKVCTREVATGSIVAKRVCRTETEIQAERARTELEVGVLERDRMLQNGKLLPGEK